MSDIDSGPYFKEINSEVFGAVDAILENADGYTASSYLNAVEDDLLDLADAYELSHEELEALGNEVSNRLQVKSVLGRNEEGVYFVQFFIESDARGDR